MSGMRGVAEWAFPCSPEVEQLVAERLRSYWIAKDTFVEEPILYRDGAVRYRVDLARLGHDDGPAAELMVRRDLEQVVGRRKLPTDPPDRE